MKSNVTVIAHRGWWTTPAEQNTIAAFARAFDAGLGVELDVRDFAQILLVSHDPPSRNIRNGIPEGSCRFADVIDLLAGRDLPLAVNVKACGLAPLFARVEPKPKSWFFFDVAPGDEESYPKHNLELFVREHWDTSNPVLTISPEIFGLDPADHWRIARTFAETTEKTVLLVTDRPAAAVEFFK